MVSAFHDSNDTDGGKKFFENMMGGMKVVNKTELLHHGWPQLLKITPGGAASAARHLPGLEIVDGSHTAAPDASHVTTTFDASRLTSPTAGLDASHLPSTPGALDPAHFHGIAGHDFTGLSALLTHLLELLQSIGTALPDAEQLVLSQAQEQAGYVAALDSLKKLGAPT